MFEIEIYEGVEEVGVWEGVVCLCRGGFECVFPLLVIYYLFNQWR
jgi:hypothetical protein